MVSAATCLPCNHLREERYVEIRDEMKHMLTRVGWKADFVEKSVPIIPISGWMGDNLIKKSENMKWWNGMDIVGLNKEKVHIETLLNVSEAAGWQQCGCKPLCWLQSAAECTAQGHRGGLSRP